MDLGKLTTFLAAPIVCLFGILIVCDLVVQRPVSWGVAIPMMRVRAEPLNNCEFNGFTIYLRSDGKIGGGERDSEVIESVVLSRVAEARDDIQDETIFVIADPEVQYGQFVDFIAKIREVAPADHIAAVTRAGQVQAFTAPSGRREVWADRCRFEWPALPGQPKWSPR
jgi:biopolymer transport protein ExbD